ncbi:hypothetical protein BD770DRAFT_476284 [Pilaira anomala]|nr:hypothetical protein BD770DRAFT_476284 [Pilaira anomala]
MSPLERNFITFTEVCYFCGSNNHKSSDCPQYVHEFDTQVQEQEELKEIDFYTLPLSPQPKLLLFHHHDDDTLVCNTITPASNIF